MAMCLGFPLLLTLVGLIVRTAGASLRPIIFMAVLMIPLALTFLVAALIRARQPSTQSETTFSPSVQDGHFADREKLFGTDLPLEQIRDAKSVFPEFFGGAEHAELGIVGIGETVLVAQFPTSDAVPS